MGIFNKKDFNFNDGVKILMEKVFPIYIKRYQQSEKQIKK